MPTLTANQTLQPPASSITATVRTTASAAQVVPTPGQEAILDTGYLPGAVVTANQTLAPGKQSLRLIVTPWKGPAVPRAERQPAKPRP